MADKNIATLTGATTPLTGAEDLHVEQAGNSRKVAVSDIAERANLTFDNETGTTYTTVVGDNRKFKIHTNAAAIAVTIADTVHAIGDEITFAQGGAGALTFSGGGSMVLTSAGSLLSSNGLGAVVHVKFITTSSAVVWGDRV